MYVVPGERPSAQKMTPSLLFVILNARPLSAAAQRRPGFRFPPRPRTVLPAGGQIAPETARRGAPENVKLSDADGPSVACASAETCLNEPSFGCTHLR